MRWKKQIFMVVRDDTTVSTRVKAAAPLAASRGDDDLHGAAEAGETLLVQLALAARARGDGQQADALATVADREEEEARVRRYLPVPGWRTIGPSP